MVKIEEMSNEEMQALLERISFGHLACVHDNRPYVVPMNYAYRSQTLYFFTTEGTKTEYIAANPEVCFQVDEVDDPSHWRSVMVSGRAERITRADEMEEAMSAITSQNPALTPAINQTHIKSVERASNIVLFRIRPELITGRKTKRES